MFIVITGSVQWEHYGPFEDEVRATEWGESAPQTMGKSWWATRMRRTRPPRPELKARPFVKYTTMLEENTDDLQQSVNALLANGWLLHGTPYAVPPNVEGGTVCFAQAMVLPESG